MAALQYVDEPNYAALLIRREWGMLAMPGALLPRLNDWLAPSDARWAAGTHTWHFPSGATITFGHMQTPAARGRYQSAQFQLVCIDEVTDLLEADATFLFSRLRRDVDSTVPVRFRAASNPTGKGRVWAKRRYVDDATRERGTLFVPARLSDNPYVDQDAYIDALRRTHPVTYKRLLDGDWEITEEGLLFKASEWLADKFIDPADYDHNMPTVRYWDFAATEAGPDHPDPDWTVGLKMVLDTRRRILIIADVARFRVSPGERDKRVRTIAETDGQHVTVGIEQEPGSSGIDVIDRYRRDVLFGFKVIGDRPTGQKEVRAQNPASAMEHGQIEIVRAPWNAEFIAECDVFDGTGESHDDQVDTLSGAHKLLTHRTQRKTSGTSVADRGMVQAGPARSHEQAVRRR